MLRSILPNTGTSDSIRSIESIQIVIKCIHAVCDVSLLLLLLMLLLLFPTNTSHLCLIAISNWRPSLVFLLVAQTINSEHFSNIWLHRFLPDKMTFTHSHWNNTHIWSRFIWNYLVLLTTFDAGFFSIHFNVSSSYFTQKSVRPKALKHFLKQTIQHPHIASSSNRYTLLRIEIHTAIQCVCV